MLIILIAREKKIALINFVVILRSVICWRIEKLSNQLRVELNLVHAVSLTSLIFQLRKAWQNKSQSCYSEWQMLDCFFDKSIELFNLRWESFLGCSIGSNGDQPLNASSQFDCSRFSQGMLSAIGNALNASCITIGTIIYSNLISSKDNRCE